MRKNIFLFKSYPFCNNLNPLKVIFSGFLVKVIILLRWAMLTPAQSAADTPKGLGRDAACEHKPGQPHCHPVGTGSLFRPLFSTMLCKFKLELSEPGLPVQNSYQTTSTWQCSPWSKAIEDNFCLQLHTQRQEVLSLADLNLDSQTPQISDCKDWEFKTCEMNLFLASIPAWPLLNSP